MSRLSYFLGEVGVTLVLTMVPARFVLAASTTLMITKLQTGSEVNASAEFVELTNISSSAVDVVGWKLQYMSATGTTWTTKATLQGTVNAGETLLLATTEQLSSDSHQIMTSGLAQAGGHIQLITGSGQVQDLLGWGTAAQAEGGSPALAPDKGQATERLVDSGNNYIDTDNNAADFSLGTSPTPSPPTSPSPNPSSAAPPPASPPPTNEGLNAPLLTELLPNPASPATDDQNEFVELYNPNAQAFSLKGYKLQTGSTFSHTVSFSTETIPANGYLLITSGDTTLTLANSGGAVRLLDPSGAVLDQVTYDAAGDGQAWALSDNSWSWTMTPTSKASNVITAPIVATKAKKTTSPSSNKKSASSKVKSATTKPKSSKAASSDQNTSQTANSDASSPAAPLHTAALAAVGGLAVLYATYEYRQNIANWLYKLRRNRTTRANAREEA